MFRPISRAPTDREMRYGATWPTSRRAWRGRRNPRSTRGKARRPSRFSLPPGSRSAAAANPSRSPGDSETVGRRNAQMQKDIGVGIIGVGMGLDLLYLNQKADSRLEVRALCAAHLDRV